MSESRDEWVRIGEYLQDRRVQIDTRYANLRLFADERGINYRLAWDVEHARRNNYARATLTSLDVAYRLQPGSVRNMVAGGEPVPEDSGGGGDYRRHYDDPRLQAIENLDFPPDVRRGMINFARDWLGIPGERGDAAQMAG